jgi:hypothetical protein
MKNPVKNQRGQILVEFVLLLALGVGMSLMATRFLKDNEFAQNLIGRPWATLSGMIECGTWDGCKPGYHPNSASRILSYRPVD